MKPFNTIGIGVAFSPNLKANICEASRIALFFGCKLILIHVGDQTAEKEHHIQGLLKSFEEKGLNYDLVFRKGNPVDVILHVADHYNVDLLILGALQRENFLKYYVGSIARKITRQANCSVLLLINPSVDEIPCRHVVVSGLDDPQTPHAIRTAFYMGKKLGADRITIVEEITKQELAISVEDDRSLRKANIVKERLRLRERSRVKKILENIPDEDTRGILVKSQPIFGKRGYSIGHYAQVSRADLLVLTSPSKTTFWDRLFPHDIEHILTELPTDVLILK